MQLLSLPTEILIQIFLNLEWHDLLRAQSICKAVGELCSSTALQYHLLLGIAGYEDSPSSHPSSISQRLDQLKKLETTFHYGTFPQKERIPLDGSFTPTYELQGGVFLQGRCMRDGTFRTSGVNVFKLPSMLHNQGNTVLWKLPDLEKPVRDMTMDSSQDLLVLIEGGVAGSTTITASFLSLTSGDSHPLSSGEYVIPSPSDGAVRGFTITVMGVFMGLLISNFKFIVYDWKRGKLVVDIPFDDGDLINSFFFLDRERLGLVRGLRRPAHIEIYRFIDGNTKLSGPVLTATYHLPTLIDGVRLGEISCRSDPPPHQIETSTTYTNNSSVHSPPPFIPRLEDRIFVVDMLFLHGRTAVGTCVIVIRGETLMNVPKGSELVDGAYVVTPDLWMHDTHMQPMTTMGNWACFVYGSRFVTISFNPPIDESDSDEEEEEPGRLGWPLQIVTFDMNPRMIAWAKSKGCETTPYGISYAFGTVEDLDCTVCESNYTSVSSELLREPWVAERPLIATGFKADDIVSRVDDDFVVMLDGERLIVIQLKVGEDGTRSPLYIDVYSP